MSIRSFEPIISGCSRALILGSMPGRESLRKEQYYANRRNHFWPIIFSIFNEPLTDDYGKRRGIILQNRLALWDVFSQCDRETSLDSDIRNAQLNDMEGLFASFPNIKRVFCNGRKAFDSFSRNFDFKEVRYLPSTSPVPGRYIKSFEQKLPVWSIVGEVLKPEGHGRSDDCQSGKPPEGRE